MNLTDEDNPIEEISRIEAQLEESCARLITLMSGNGTSASSCHSQRSKTYLHSRHSLIALAGIDNQRKAWPEIPWFSTVPLYFIPMMIFYGGGRREEYCGLMTDDVIEDNGAYPYLHIAKNKFRRIKNGQSKRNIVIIPSLSGSDSCGMSRSSARSDMNWSSLICFRPQPNRRWEIVIINYSNRS